MASTDELHPIELLLAVALVTAEAAMTLAVALVALVLSLAAALTPPAAAAVEPRRPLPVAPLPPDLPQTTLYIIQGRFLLRGVLVAGLPSAAPHQHPAAAVAADLGPATCPPAACSGGAGS